ncbi:MAG TPA: hypothetical protein PKM59_04780 [Thermodesulfobacteriota bacterium]|nr:hypothetical protein [Deltaproteobacteria bacterium]HNR12615.1 hypothetical protein [Thermodesulfobacteriota bacterium]HNU71757.1 hypothetical protein [Thermodesulfobacteriota bacterium]
MATKEVMENKDYDLVSVLYHVLQGAETAQHYQQDAEREGDQEVAQYFQKAHENYQQLADQAKSLLASRISKR